jgi:hypothetical protein
MAENADRADTSVRVNGGRKFRCPSVREMDTLGAKEQERQGKIFKKIAEVLSKMGE